jgi:hypothetical protein
MRDPLSETMAVTARVCPAMSMLSELAFGRALPPA